MRSSATGLGMAPELEALLRRGDPQAGQKLEAILRTRQDLRTRKAQWNLADSLTGLTVLNDGGVRLTDTVSILIQQDSAETAFFQDAELDGRLPFTAAVVEWAGTEPVHIEIARVKAKLHPRRDPAQPKQVAKWRLDLLRPVRVGFMTTTGRQLVLAPIAEPVLVEAVGEAEGYVTFDYSLAPVIERPRPKREGTPDFLGQLLPNLFLAAPAPVTIFLISALKADGSPAGNVGLAYDAAQASVTTGGNILSGRKFVVPGLVLGFDPRYPTFPATHADAGAAAGTPRIIIESGTYANATLTFSQAGNRLDLGGVPTADVVFTVQGAVPTGCQLTGQVLKDGGTPATDADWRTFLSGQKSTDLADVSKRQTYELRGKLVTDATAALTPTLRKLAVEELTASDMSDYAELQLQGGYGIDAVSLQGEIVRGMIVGIRDGERDYHSAIEDLLAAADLGKYLFRLWIGATSLAKDKWLHIDDFLPEGQRPRAADYAIPVVSPLILLRGLLPKYSPGTTYAPDGDVAVGAYTTEAGGTTNLYLKLNEAAADDATYIRSELDPVNSVYKASFPTPTDYAGRRLYLDYRFQKDAAAGKTIDATIELRQSATLISFQTHTNISEVVTAGSFRLTDAQIALITDPANLQLWVTCTVGGAGGSRRGIVTWARFRSEGRKDAVRYANQSVKAVFDDIIANQLELDVQWRGPGLEDTTTLVGKTISEVTDEDAPTSKAELEALAYLVGYGLLGSQGKLKAVNMKDPGAVAAYFPLEEVRLLSITPGIEERIEEFVVPFNWNVAADKFDDEWRGASAAGVLAFGEAKLDPPARLDPEVAEWIIPQAGADYAVHARRVGQRVIEWFGAGRGRADFTSAYMYPELEPGDTVALEQDELVLRDFHTGVEVRGRRWVIGKLELCNDPQALGRRFTMAFRPYVDVLTDGEAATRLGFETPSVLGIDLSVADTGVVSSVIRASGGQSVKVATSTSAFPSAATVRAAAAQALDASGMLITATLATLTAAQTLYVSVFAYEAANGAGAESLIAQAQTTFTGAGEGTNRVKSAIVKNRGGSVYLYVVLDTLALSFKWAFSTASFPAAGTGTCVNALSASTLVSTFVYADHVFITITPYSGGGCTGTAGPAYQVRAQLTTEENQFDDTTGKRPRGALFVDGHLALKGDVADSLGERAHTNVKDSRLTLFNSHFGKTVDDRDDLVDGLTFGGTKLTALTLGEVDLAKAGVIGVAPKAKVPSATAYRDEVNTFTQRQRVEAPLELKDLDATPVADRRLQIVDGEIRATTTLDVEGQFVRGASLKEGTGPLAQVTSAGHAGSGMQDSRALAINTMFGKTVDDTDDVTQGLTLRLVTGVSAGNQVQTASIGAEAVTEPKSKAKERGKMSRTGAGQSINNNTLTTIDFQNLLANVGNVANVTTDDMTIPASPDNVGMWIFIASVLWAANATGYRRIGITNTGGEAIDIRSAAPTLGTGQMVTWFVNDPAAASTYQVDVRQTSGGALTCTVFFTAFRVW